jgi:NADH-ubiquinone oxidoreductase chain 6
MNSLFIFNEDITSGFIPQSVDIFSLAAIVTSIFVIISKNPIVSVLFLIGLFLSISCYLITLGLNFIGLSYLLVYVGAVSILFLFILMLINVRVSELYVDASNSVPLAIMIIISFNYPLNKVLPYNNEINVNYTTEGDNANLFSSIFSYISQIISIYAKTIKSSEIKFVTSKVWDGNLSESNHITTIGNIIYSSYSIWLIITSIILLLAMVGAIVITIKK